MLRSSAVAFFVICGFVMCGATATLTTAPPARAADCYPHCDYNHYYGPSDFTYVRPGLFAYPRCNARGECSPALLYSSTGLRRGNITIRFLPQRNGTRPPQ
jgi:hypothetical protein